MSARDELALNLVTVTLSPDAEDRTVYLPATDQCNEMVRDLAAAYGDLATTTSADVQAAAALLAAGYRKPRTITTVEELDALPDGSIVMADWATHQRILGQWATFGSPATSQPELPATVLHEPEAEATR